MALSRPLAAAALVVLAALTSARAQTPDAVAALQAKLDEATQQMAPDLAGAMETLDHLAVDSIELRKSRPLSAAERPVHSRLFLLRARGHIQLLNNDKVREGYLGV